MQPKMLNWLAGGSVAHVPGSVPAWRLWLMLPGWHVRAGRLLHWLCLRGHLEHFRPMFSRTDGDATIWGASGSPGCLSGGTDFKWHRHPGRASVAWAHHHLPGRPDAQY